MSAAGGIAALFPLVVGLLCAFVALKRHQPTTRRIAARTVALQPAS
jgi:hypothetical protein